MENLKYLFSAYFHQDWNHTHDTWQGVIDDFAANNIDESTQFGTSLEAVLREIDEVLAQTPDDAELAELVLRLGSVYDADVKDGGDRAWLRAIRDRIATALAARDVDR